MTDVCPEKTRRCEGSPLCLPQESYCDGVQDCRSDDDEANCKSWNRGAKMCAPTGRCIPRRELCDGILNCSDGSDEIDCECKLCSGSDRALCSNSRCLTRSQVCDGVSDCEGGLDEKNCPGTCRVNDSSSSVPSTVKTVQCSDGRRYPQTEACSGQIVACSRSCKKCDPALTFTCADGMCIMKKNVCDGTPDCDGGEDETGCKETCTASRPIFRCASGSKCISVEARCDDVPSLYLPSNPPPFLQCPSSSLHCLADKRCLPSIARCDGIADCADGSDEADCSCLECTAAHSDMYACEKSRHCFKRDSVCAPYSMCPNATHVDKLFCAAKALERSFF
ncbi:hypothetical protein PENTCL1PPCAC_26270 [Pristionchus entomophagus]|uniref:Lipoprotein receptor n=1 Tax=Pristionchus entomophagus TaxID=358040 RepID=A0AAV5UC66_9BILA|nr:hypothetical protein PENTCL1PPCAC_26270 [Pristionchus entomophagus]